MLHSSNRSISPSLSLSDPLFLLPFRSSMRACVPGLLRWVIIELSMNLIPAIQSKWRLCVMITNKEREACQTRIEVEYSCSCSLDDRTSTFVKTSSPTNVHRHQHQQCPEQHHQNTMVRPNHTQAGMELRSRTSPRDSLPWRWT